jgi:hypothetical protein
MKKLSLTIMAIISAFGISIAQPADKADNDAEGQKKQAAAEAPVSVDSLKEHLTNLQGQVDGINESYLATKATADKLSKIKISGYTQFQVRAATGYKDAARQSLTDTAGLRKSVGTGAFYYPVGNYAGGAFGTGVNSLIQLRRARVKVAYESDLSTGVIQFDCIPFTVSNVAGTSLTTVPDTIKDSLGRTHIVPKSVSTAATPVLGGGGVTIKDAYLRFADPWLKTFAIKGGVFDRPFGFEIGYSSGNRESPERSRTEQTLFPGERDLGISLEMLPGDNMPSWFQLFNFKGGVFTGNGINVENDKQRDYIGRLGMSLPFREAGLGIDFGVSGYFGKLTDWNDTAYTFNKDNKNYDRSVGNLQTGIDRKYYGGDLQLYYSLPFGGLSLRGEGYMGTQPVAGKSASSASTSSPSSNVTSSSPVYSRPFLGYYAWLVQNIDILKSQLVVKYDVYDPNTAVSSPDSAAVVNGGLTIADMSFNTIGLGWIYHWDENVKLVLYYDIVNNEQVSDKGGSTYFKKNANWWVYTDAMKASVLTFRIQYKF